MPAPLALLLTTIFVVFLFWRDVRERPPVTGALWIPLLWMLILGSRGVSEWLGWGGTYNTTDGLAEGSLVDAAVYFSFQLAALFVLLRRRLSWATALSHNPWIVIFLAYCALAIFWSDFPFVALKRWIKVLAHPLMVLVVATEPDPREAVVRLLKRSAYVLVPFSILLIKYYPALGRRFSQWTGEAYNSCVTSNKNILGCLCLVLGFFFVWHFLTSLRREKTRERRNELLLCGAFLWMIGWLLSMADSATSVMALAVGISTVLFLGLRFVDKRHVTAYLVAALLAFGSAELIFGVSGTLIRALGRDSTLTGRTEIWDIVLAVDINPILGAGFESFWLGDRAERIWAKYWFHPNQAHNGYLETYLNLGWLGLTLMVCWILSAFLRVGSTLLSDFDFGRFRMGLLAIVVVYNYTEGGFKGLSLIWFAFYIIAMDYPQARRPIEGESSASRPWLATPLAMHRRDA